MENTIHFISGLPRAGSTLLSAILRQNPAFHAGMTSPVGSLYMALEGAMSRRNEASVFLDAGQRRALLRGVFAGYYHAADPATVIFDTNRLWCARLAALAKLFPQARVICCVRDVLWIVDSIERQASRNPFELSGLFGFEPGGTVYTRVARVAASGGMVGYALDALREACFRAYSARLILINYEALARAPGPTIKELYRLLGEPPLSLRYPAAPPAPPVPPAITMSGLPGPMLKLLLSPPAVPVWPPPPRPKREPPPPAITRGVPSGATTKPPPPPPLLKMMSSPRRPTATFSISPPVSMKSPPISAPRPPATMNGGELAPP